MKWLIEIHHQGLHSEQYLIDLYNLSIINTYDNGKHFHETLFQRLKGDLISLPSFLKNKINYCLPPQSLVETKDPLYWGNGPMTEHIETQITPHPSPPPPDEDINFPGDNDFFIWF